MSKECVVGKILESKLQGGSRNYDLLANSFLNWIPLFFGGYMCLNFRILIPYKDSLVLDSTGIMYIYWHRSFMY